MDLFLRSLPVDREPEAVEVVEHKGLGHPDTMCDAFAEAFALELDRYYVEHFGAPAHFNVDKALLVGGASQPAFGGGRILSPMRILMAGRVTREVRGVRVPVEEIAERAGKAWVRCHMHALDPETQMSWSCLSNAGSADLVDLFVGHGNVAASRLANDTSLGVGFAPASPLERVVLAVADHLKNRIADRPEIGEDVKIMGVRRGDDVRLTVACAFIGRYLSSVDDYLARRNALTREIADVAKGIVPDEVSVEMNAGDDPTTGRVYLTVTGTSAEAGDDGQVGRGNRVGGLITPYRPMSIEAAAGKNPSSHVGKLYNVAAHRIAHAVVDGVPEVAEVQCYLLSRIGSPIDDPMLVDVRVKTRDGVSLEAVRKQVDAVVREGVGDMSMLAGLMQKGMMRLF